MKAIRIAALIAGFACLTGMLQAQEFRFLDSQGVRIRYTDQGRGEPLILLHGNGGKIESWDGSTVFVSLLKNYRVIRFDARGHGESGKPHDPKAYGVEMGLDAVRLMDHLGIDRAHVVGYSMGGNITSLLLTHRPERFKAAALIAGPGRLHMTATEEAEWEQEAAERERECVSRTQIMRLAPRDLPMPTEADIQARSKQCFAQPENDPKALAAYVRSRKYLLVDLQKLKALKVPTLGIVGDQDSIMAGMKELKGLRPDMPLVIVAGATHGGSRGIITRDETASELTKFLAAHR